MRLDLREAELGDQSLSGVAGIARVTNERDDRVEMIERDLQPLEDVPPRFRFAQLELGPAARGI